MVERQKTRECPYCKEEIKAEAVKCKHCSSRITPERPRHEGICPFCKEEIHPEATRCKHCRSILNTGEDSDCRCEEGQPVGAGSDEAAMAAMRGAFGGFGGLGPTLPKCEWKQQWVDCGSALPGYPVPKCLEWVYHCWFPGSSRNIF